MNKGSLFVFFVIDVLEENDRDDAGARRRTHCCNLPGGGVNYSKI